MTLKYEIQFLDYWHMGSGLSFGAKLDSAVIRDKENIPYVPGKTIKGLVREMAEEFGCDFLNHCFGGTTDDKEKCYDEAKKNVEGTCYFSNAKIQETTKQQIITNKLQDNLYSELASTKIGRKGNKNETEGISVDNSLREIEVVIPISVFGEINDLDEKFIENMTKSLTMIKRMGLNRNRGLGRCQISILEVV
ncbi:DUF324 domain-containing protein [hydrothermal vent metagenome]|uniref:DUF324 domain-containing protein n=1 Tax=hydrothermal vent metagenome TaxID=652676 RepID=A0A1W1EEI8_9ZZZZ